MGGHMGGWRMADKKKRKNFVLGTPLIVHICVIEPINMSMKLSNSELQFISCSLYVLILVNFGRNVFFWGPDKSISQSGHS